MSETLLFALGAACTLYALGQTSRLAHRAWSRQHARSPQGPRKLRRDRRTAARRAGDRASETIVVINPEDA